MHPTMWPYIAGTSLGYSLIAAPLWGILRLSGVASVQFAQRLGSCPVLPPHPADGNGRLWLQAVSVGEVRLALPLIRGLINVRPGVEVVLSVGTPAGFREAKRLAGGLAEVIYFPLDTLPSVRRALRRIRPTAVVLLETELWPVFLHTAAAFGVRLGLINGRISERSARFYRYLGPLFRPALSGFHLAGAISGADAARLAGLGIPSDRLVVTGNAKSEAAPPESDGRAVDELKSLFCVDGRPVWVAGSIRGGETEEVVNAFVEIRRRVPEAMLIIAPRHLLRLGQIQRHLGRAGLEHQLRSELGPAAPRRAPVVILDTMGELMSVYALADAAYVGASLTDQGGQNPLEPAWWGVPVLFGPHMDDFREPADRLLAAGGAIRVNTAGELAGRVTDLLTDGDLRRRTGHAAREVGRVSGDAAGKSIDLMRRILAGC